MIKKLSNSKIQNMRISAFRKGGLMKIYEISYGYKLVASNAKTPVKKDNYIHLSFIRFSQNFKT